jgi:hypothetical protein
MSSSLPIPICTTDLAGATCSIVGSKAVLTGFPTLARSQKVTIDITGIRNPNTIVVSNFDVTASTSTSNVIANVSFASAVGFTAAGVVGSASLTVTGDFVSSAVTSNYNFALTFSNELYADSIIKVTLPSAYNISGLLFKCTVSGAVTQFRHCRANASTELELQLSSGFSAG